MAHAALAEHALIDDRNFRRGGQVDVVSLAFNDETHRQAGAHQRRFLQRLETVDRLAIDGFDQVSGPETGRGRRAVQFDPPDAGRVLDPAEGHEHPGEDHERQDEIGDRPGQHDRRPVEQRLPGQRQGGIDGWVGRRGAFNAGDIGVAVKLDISAERKRAHAPAGAAQIHPGKELRPEAQRERVDFDPAPSPNQIMAEFVNEHDRAQDHDERNDVPPQPGNEVRNSIQQRHRTSGTAQSARPGSAGCRWIMVSKALQHPPVQAKSRRVLSPAIW